MSTSPAVKELGPYRELPASIRVRSAFVELDSLLPSLPPLLSLALADSSTLAPFVPFPSVYPSPLLDLPTLPPPTHHSLQPPDAPPPSFNPSLLPPLATNLQPQNRIQSPHPLQPSKTISSFDQEGTRSRHSEEAGRSGVERSWIVESKGSEEEVGLGSFDEGRRVDVGEVGRVEGALGGVHG